MKTSPPSTTQVTAERKRTGLASMLSYLSRLCLRLRSNRSADRRYRNALVRFTKRRGVIELWHFRLTRMMQRDDVPAVFVEHRTARAPSFGRRPVVYAAIAARNHDVVVEGEGKPASAGVADDVEPPSPFSWRPHRQRFV